jgi:hypothetical protein
MISLDRNPLSLPPLHRRPVASSGPPGDGTRSGSSERLDPAWGPEGGSGPYDIILRCSLEKDWSGPWRASLRSPIPSNAVHAAGRTGPAQRR